MSYTNNNCLAKREELFIRKDFLNFIFFRHLFELNNILLQKFSVKKYKNQFQ